MAEVWAVVGKRRCKSCNAWADVYRLGTSSFYRLWCRLCPYSAQWNAGEKEAAR